MKGEKIMCYYFDENRGVCLLKEKYGSSSEKYVPNEFKWEYCKASADWKSKECPTYKKHG